MTRQPTTYDNKRFSYTRKKTARQLCCANSNRPALASRPSLRKWHIQQEIYKRRCL